MASSRRESDRPFGGLFGDAWRKLAAVGLAALLWFFLDRQVNVTPEPIAFSLGSAGEGEAPSGTIAVRIPGTGHTLERFQDGLTGETITSAALTVRGPKHLIAAFDENAAFWVRAPDLSQGVFEFTLDDVRAENERLQALLHDMRPKSVRVLVAQNASRSLPILWGMLSVTPPANVQNFEDRVSGSEARFEPSQNVTLEGPKHVLDELLNRMRPFKVVLSSRSSDQLGGRIELNEPSGPVFMKPDNLSVIVPLLPSLEPFALEEVPVVLDETLLSESLRGRYELETASARITILAGGALETLLSGMTDEQRRQWARRNAVLIAQIPADITTNSDELIKPRFVLRPTEYVENRDYKVTYIDPLSVRPL